MHSRWMLDLCFKTELKVLPNIDKNGLEVDIVLVSEPPFGSVVEVAFDPKLLRLRQPNGHSELRPKRRTRGLDESSYSREVDRLLRQPGLNNLSEVEQDAVLERFQDHLTYVVKAKKAPTFYRCTSLGTLYEGRETVLYVPPIDPSTVLAQRTPTNRHLPTEPTVYGSVDEALVVPTLMVLWAGGDVAKDAAITLESGGAAEMPRIRVVYSALLDGEKWLPFLFGSLKQVAWASEIRMPVAEAIWAEATRHGMPDLPKGEGKSPAREEASRALANLLGWKWRGKEKELLAKLVAELDSAEEADAWINHRKSAIEWLAERAERSEATAPFARPTKQPLVLPTPPEESS